MADFNLNIDIDEKYNNDFTAHTDRKFLVGITMKLNPEAAMQLAHTISISVLPIIKWRTHPLNEWAKNKIAKSTRRIK